jgi:DNA-binding transcriptional ArsR family regulator
VSEGPSLAKLAALVAEPSRAQMLAVLMAGQALTATELADAAGIGRAAASAHLARLQSAGLLRALQQGRHRYFRLAGDGVAGMIEQMLGLAERMAAKPLVTGPRDTALRESRVCYDHLAGERAVALLDRLLARHALRYDGPALALGEAGSPVFQALGIDLAQLGGTRRPLCRGCLDWSARREHLAGALGAALLQLAFARRWARRLDGSRVVVFSAAGDAAWSAIGA